MHVAAEPIAALPTLTWLPQPLLALRAGQSGRYTEFTPLGSGGKAEVFRCRDRQLGREVAYKVLHHRLANNEAEVADLVREARIMAGLAHPGVPTVFDIGLDCHGRPFFTQTLITGATLRSVVDGLRHGGMTASDAWPPERIVRVLLSAADAISHAHARGVLHCDLKPDNVIVGPDDRGHVIDWGIACVPAELIRQRGLMAPGAPPPRPPHRGSPLYMAPEQAANLPLDQRTDVFGLGAVLYECLTLSPPATGRNVADVLGQIETTSPPTPRQRSPRRGITPELDELTMRALARLPADRFGSAIEFQLALREAHLDLLVNYDRDPPPSADPLESPCDAAELSDWWELQLTDQWPGAGDAQPVAGK